MATNMKLRNIKSFWLTLEITIGILFIYSACQIAPSPNPTLMMSPGLAPSPEPEIDCSAVERLPNDSAESQQILEELVQNLRIQQPTEYMGMTVLDRVDRLGEWAVIQGSVSGDDTDILVARRTPQGYQLAERYLVTPSLLAFDGSDKRITEYFLEKLPDAPGALFTCLEPTWLRASEPSTDSSNVYQLAYLGTSDGTTGGVTEIHAVQSDGSNHRVLLSAPMLIMGLVSSPGGEQITFWGCPGSLSNDCSPDEDLDVWVVNWDGSNLTNLTEDSTQSDSHPDWSPNGKQIVFDSDRSGTLQLYIMNADGSHPKALTDDSLQNTEPKWSSDGKWIAYHCRQGFETRICVVSPDGATAGESISGTMPVWSYASVKGLLWLAFLCFQGGYSDICTARPDGSDLVNLTKSPADERSPAWSPDGNWLAFVSNRNNDVDIYKLCVTCPGEPNIIRLTDEPRSAGWPAWSPDGRWISYADVPGQTLMLVKADRSDIAFLDTGVLGPAIWSP